MTEPHAPPPDSDCLAWVDQHYPFDPSWETILLRRMPEERATPQTQSELNDLRGIRDREQAALLASIWYRIRANTERQRAKDLGTTRRELADIDDTITGRYP